MEDFIWKEKSIHRSTDLLGIKLRLSIGEYSFRFEYMFSKGAKSGPRHWGCWSTLTTGAFMDRVTLIIQAKFGRVMWYLLKQQNIHCMHHYLREEQALKIMKRCRVIMRENIYA